MAEKIPVDIERVAEHIAEYLASNPHAADTVAGIQSWWLSGETRGVSRRDVERAARLLVQRGMLQCHTLPDGTRIYARVQRVAARAT